MTMLKLIWRHSRLRPGRTLLTVLGVALGVAAIVCVSSLTISTRDHFRRLNETVSGKGVLEIVPVSVNRFDASPLDELRKLPGVKAVVPEMRQYTVLFPGEKRTVQVLAVGIDATRADTLEDFRIVSGRLPTAAGEVALDTTLAHSLNLSLGAAVKLLTHEMLQSQTVVGFVEPTTGASVGLSPKLFLPLTELQRYFDAENLLDSIHVIPDPSSDIVSLEHQLTRILPPHLRIKKAGMGSTPGEKIFELMERGLDATTVFLVITALFVSSNTLLINLWERRRHFAMLRAIGATVSQIRSSLFLEACVIGAIASIVGICLGIVASNVLQSGLGQALQLAHRSKEVPLISLVLGGVFGPLICLLSVGYPAMVVGRITPLEGMRPEISQTKNRRFEWLLVPGLCSLIASTTLLGYSAWYNPAIPFRLTLVATVWVIISGLMVLAATQSRLASIATRLLSPILRIEADLAKNQVLRNQARTFLAASTLFIVLGCTVALGNAILSMVHQFQDWYDRTVVADFIIRPMMPPADDQLSADMPWKYAAEVSEMPGVRKIDPVTLARCAVGGDNSLLVLRDFRAYSSLPLILTDGEPETVYRKLLAGEAVVDTRLVKRMKVKVGDHITVANSMGSTKVRIAGIITDFGYTGAVVTLQREFGAPLARLDNVDIILVRNEPGQHEAVRRQLDIFCQERGLLLHTHESLKALLDSYKDSLVNSLWLLFIAGFAIASFGLFNTMAMHVLEQTRELGILRAVGLDKRQTRRMFATQGIIITSIGIFPGLLLGLLIAAMLNVWFEAFAGMHITFRLHPWFLCGQVAAAFLLLVGSSFLMGARASRLDIKSALSYE